MAAFVQTALLILTFFPLAYLCINYLNNSEVDRLIGGMLIPATLWIAYGLGGLFILVFRDISRIDYYGYDFSDVSVLIVSMFVLTSSVFYILTFNLMYKSGEIPSERLNSISYRRLELIALVFLIYDWSIRLFEIKTGTYSKWMIAHSDFAHIQSSNPLFMIQTNLWGVLLAILVFLYMKKSRMYIIPLSAQLLLILFEGSRTSLLLAIVIVFLSATCCLQAKISKKMVSYVLIVSTTFLLLIGPIIQEVRYPLRRDASILLKEPMKLPGKLLTVYLPEVLSWQRLHGDLSMRKSNKVTIVNRIAGWQAYMATINERIYNGQPTIGVSKYLNNMKRAIPEILFPGRKPKFTSALDVYNNYMLNRRSLDPASSAVGEVFAYLFWPGLVVLMTFLGGFYALFIGIHYRMFKNFSGVLLCGFIPAFNLFHNSFSTVLAEIRNTILLMIIIYLGIYITFRPGGKDSLSNKTGKDIGQLR